VPPERAALVMGMLLSVPVSVGWVDKAAARVSAQLGKTAPHSAGQEEEKEEADPEEKDKAAAGAPHVLIVRTPDGRLTFLQATGSPSAATSIRPPPTASPPSTPSAAPSQESPGYRHSPPQPDTNSRHPVNGH
jgi:hypothetical protein